MTGDLPSSIVAEIAFIQRSGGLVKALPGFKKSHHTIPDAANGATNAFLGKICADELGSEAEALFQAVRAGLGYKRKDISLSLVSPGAVLTAKDFLVDGRPAGYLIGDGTVPVLVGRSGPIELWRLDPTAGAPAGGIR